MEVGTNMGEKRIMIHPEICHGKPCIQGTRIPVDIILELLEHGLTFTEILEEYPQLEKADIQACIAFTRRVVERTESSSIVNSEVSS